MRAPSLEDMSINMATSLTSAAADPEKTRIPRPEERPVAIRESEAKSNSLAVVLSSASAIVLVVALAIVVFVGQKRIAEITTTLNRALAEEKAGRARAEQDAAHLKEQLATTGTTLKDREEKLDETQRQAQRLRETGEKTKTQLQTQLDDTGQRLTAASEDLADTRKALDDERETSRAKIAETQMSLQSVTSERDRLGEERDARLRDLAVEKRRSSDLSQENAKLKDDQARESAAVKKLLVEMTQLREQAAAEKSRREALEAQLRRAGLTPEGGAPPRTPPRVREHDDHGDDEDVSERDLR